MVSWGWLFALKVVRAGSTQSLRAKNQEPRPGPKSCRWPTLGPADILSLPQEDACLSASKAGWPCFSELATTAALLGPVLRDCSRRSRSWRHLYRRNRSGSKTRTYERHFQLPEPSD